MSLVRDLRRVAVQETRLAVPDAVLRAVRRGTGAAAPRRALAGRRVRVEGSGAWADAVAAEVARLGGEPGGAGVPHAVIVVADAAPRGDDFAACASAARERYLAVVRVTLDVLPALRARRRGQIIVLSPAERPAEAATAAARAAIDAHVDCATPELLRDGVTLAHVRVPAGAEPSQAARAVVDALVHRPRRPRSRGH